MLSENICCVTNLRSYMNNFIDIVVMPSDGDCGWGNVAGSLRGGEGGSQKEFETAQAPLYYKYHP